MELGFVAITVVSIIVGVFGGVIIGRIKQAPSVNHGLVYVDCSDPKIGPYLFLEPSVPIETIISSKQVTFDVCVIDQKSHK